jgi:hypothetical protein
MILPFHRPFASPIGGEKRDAGKGFSPVSEENPAKAGKNNT